MGKSIGSITDKSLMNGQTGLLIQHMQDNF